MVGQAVVTGLCILWRDQNGGREGTADLEAKGISCGTPARDLLCSRECQ